ncbi:hypothetical protein [Amycolatopsis tolypomycina]|uniref:hypothetical protein n=1 Tax=Amycolatopsis tolypomycina TaxID=208445 RepID=UPI00116003B3|nr:hypothetical protein [Amycolatopsis tolypomycina]
MIEVQLGCGGLLHCIKSHLDHVGRRLYVTAAALPPCSTPELDQAWPVRRAREKIILVITIQAFAGFLIIRGYPVEAALAASSATVVLAHESTRIAGRLRFRDRLA